ncbi:MAG: NADP oxidoreductase, partial [Candidatus Rokuibacteriota bacterium]
IRERQPRVVSYADWLKRNEIEVQRGRAQGRPRVKLTRVEEMLAALGR